MIAPLGFCGGKTIVDDYLREIRPFFDLLRTLQRTVCAGDVVVLAATSRPNFFRTAVAVVDDAVRRTR